MGPGVVSRSLPDEETGKEGMPCLENTAREGPAVLSNREWT